MHDARPAGRAIFSEESSEPIVVAASALMASNTGLRLGQGLGSPFRNGGRSSDAESKEERDDSRGRKQSPAPALSVRVNLDSFLTGTRANSFLGLIMAVVCDTFTSGLPLNLLRAGMHSVKTGGWHDRSRDNMRAMTILRQFLPFFGGESPAALRAKSDSGGSNRREHRAIEIHGIPNFGQTCFLNSVLQSLASLEPFVAYLDRIAQVYPRIPRAPVPEEEEQTSSSTTCFSQQVLQLLHNINGGRNDDDDGASRRSYFRRRSRIDPRTLLRRVGEQNPQFQSNYMEQQDAQELLQALLGLVIADAKLDMVPSSVESFLGEGAMASMPSGGSVLSDEVMSSAEAGGPSPSIEADDSSSIGGSYVSVGPRIESALSLSSLIGFAETQPEVIDVPADAVITQTSNKSRFNGVVENGSVSSSQNSPTEKKQDEFEIPRAQHGAVADYYESNGHNANESLSASMQIMKTTISSITPSPLSGWLGSTLQCCNCKHVRPIQNAPFVDIPVIPTSVPRYLSHAFSGQSNHSRVPSPASSVLPSCTLQQCLTNFTHVERVDDVECRNCTILKEISELEDEAMILRGAIETALKRKKGERPISMQDDLSRVEVRLMVLRTMNPDEENPSLLESMYSDDDWMIGSGADDDSVTSGSRKLERCQALKCLVLTRRPSIFCCHIQRRYFDPSTRNMEKCIQLVEFPDVLDLGPYCAYTSASWVAGSGGMDSDDDDTCSSMPYKLRSVIEHCGNAHGGHYVSYRCDHLGKWCRISDDVVTSVEWHQVRRCQAYMLFYEAM